MIRLELERRRKGLTQEQLAAAAGVSRQLVTAIESGRRQISLGTGKALTKALGLPKGERVKLGNQV